MARRFLDRSEAGRRLGERLLEMTHQDPVVLGLPTGGVVVAYEVAVRLGVPLDVFVVRRLGVPRNEEVPMGAVASGGIRIVDETAVARHGVTDDTLATVAAEEQHALERSERRYRGQRAEPMLRGRTVVLVDEGLGPDSVVASAAAALRSRDPAELIVAVPVGDPEACEALRDVVDAVVCPCRPRPFGEVAGWYRDFGAVGDEEVPALLMRREGELRA